MVEFLTKDQILHARGEDGNILPQVVELELIPGEKKPKVKVLPMTKGELTEIFKKAKDNKGDTTDEDDSKLIAKHLVEPKITAEELTASGKIQYIGAIVIALMSVSSGISQKKLSEGKVKALEEKTDFQ